jgi:hypothetical protein
VTGSSLQLESERTQLIPRVVVWPNASRQAEELAKINEAMLLDVKHAPQHAVCIR